MTYDPYQSYAIQNYAMNPAAAWNPLTAFQGQPGYSAFNPQLQFNPQYGQNPLLTAGLNPTGLNHGASYHSLLQQLAAQQLAAQQLAQQIIAQQLAAQPMVAQQGGLYPQAGQIGFGGQAFQGLGQPGSPFHQMGVPLAPQSWVGQAGQLGGGQANPILLAQLTARALQAQGIAPGVGFQG
jgi:hypothetical protein